MSIIKNSMVNVNKYTVTPKAEKSNTDDTKLNVIAHTDASDGTVEPFLAARVDSFEKAKTKAGKNIDLTSQVYRAGVTPKSKIIKGLGILGVHLAIPAAGFLVGGPIGLAVGGLIDAGMFVLGITKQGLGTAMSGFVHRKSLPGEADWKGKRVYNVGADKTEGIDTKPAVIDENAGKKPSSGELANFIANGMKKHPSATNVVYLGGHGFGYKQVASMTANQLKGVLARSEQLSGKKPDVVVMESCLMGNVEAMSELKDSAKVALVSEEVVAATALPIDDMLADAANKGGTPEEIGKRMIDLAKDIEGVETYAAVNLEKMKPLLGKMNTLGKLVQSEIAMGKKADVQEAVKKAMKFPQGKLMFLERKMVNFSDLGGFVKALDSDKFSNTTRKAAKETLKAIDDVIIAKTTREGYKETSGLSFQVKSNGMLESSPEMAPYFGVDMPHGWKGMINQISMKDK